jgi:anti-sigma-K factor RskA
VNYDRAGLLDALAARYVVGTMASRPRRRFERLRSRLPAADAAAIAWERRTAPLAMVVPPVVPSASVWEAIDRRTGGREARSERAAAAPGRAWWSWLVPLAGLAFGVLATVGVMRGDPARFLPIDEMIQRRGTLPASYVGILVDAAGEARMLASSTRHGRTMSIKVLKPIDVPAGKVLQLWALPAEGPPFPVGVVPREGKGAFEMADTSEKLLSSVTRLAVSIEDASATAGAAPGPFLLQGHCVKLW